MYYVDMIHLLVDLGLNLWRGKASEEDAKQFKKNLEFVVKEQALIQTKTLQRIESLESVVKEQASIQTKTLQRIKNLEVKATYLIWLVGFLSIMILALILFLMYFLL